MSPSGAAGCATASTTRRQAIDAAAVLREPVICAGRGRLPLWAGVRDAFCTDQTRWFMHVPSARARSEALDPRRACGWARYEALPGRVVRVGGLEQDNGN